MPTSNYHWKQKILFSVIPWVLYGLIQVLFRTCKIYVSESTGTLLKKNQNSGFVYSIWHENILNTSFLLRKQGVVGVVSNSKDGEYISRVLVKFGFQTARGSSSKGANAVAKAILKSLQQGQVVALTPDGPLGPKHNIPLGTLKLMALAKKPIIPWHCEAEKQWLLNSWDQHKIPKPFTKIVVCTGEPYAVCPEKLATNPKAVEQELRTTISNNIQKTQELLKKPNL